MFCFACSAFWKVWLIGLKSHKSLKDTQQEAEKTDIADERYKQPVKHAVLWFWNKCFENYWLLIWVRFGKYSSVHCIRWDIFCASNTTRNTDFVFAWFLLWAELKGLGADFVFGFVQSMDGERDPRNLLLAFQAAKNIIQRGYDLGKSQGILILIYQPIPRLDFAPVTHRLLSQVNSQRSCSKWHRATSPSTSHP